MILTARNVRNKGPKIEHAFQSIRQGFGVDIIFEELNRDIRFYGRNLAVGTSRETVWVAPTSIANENYVTSNIITQIISTNAGDTQSVIVHGSTVSGGDFAFVVQSVTLNGQTAVNLATPLARVQRVFNDGATSLAGTVSVCETGTYAAGVPNTPALVHCQIRAGQQRSEKAAAMVPSTHYAAISKMYAGILDPANVASAQIFLEIREPGKVFLESLTLLCSANLGANFEFDPYLIVKPNSDIRLMAISDSAAGRDVGGGFEGFVFAIQ